MAAIQAEGSFHKTLPTNNLHQIVDSHCYNKRKIQISLQRWYIKVPV
jgi:hypothetical protein